MGKKYLKKDQRAEYHKEFKTGKKSTAKKHKKRAGVPLAYEIGGWTIGRFLYKVMLRKKMKQSLDKMLTHLKAVAEGIEHQTVED